MAKQYLGVYKSPKNKWKWERTQLQRAADIAHSMERTHRTMWSSLWPHAHCMNSSLLVAPAIRMALTWDVRVVVGRVEDCEPHAWIESPDGDIIDPTYGMFDFGPPLRVLPARSSWLLGHWPEVRLSIADEEHFRNSLRACANHGWAIGCGIEALFGSHPQLPAEFARRREPDPYQNASDT